MSFSSYWQKTKDVAHNLGNKLASDVREKFEEQKKLRDRMKTELTEYKYTLELERRKQELNDRFAKRGSLFRK